MKRHYSYWTVSLALVIGGLMGFSNKPTSAQVTQFGGGNASPKANVAAVVAAQFNLENGTHQVFSPYVTVTLAPQDSNGDGFYEAVAKVNLHPSSGFTKMYVLADYDHPRGFTLNIGDSETNNGGGGDLFTQERDAEMQIQGNVMSVFASDLGGTYLGSSRIAKTRLNLQTGAFKVLVSDMYLSTGSPQAEMDYTTCPDAAALLYALNGQPDAEGPVNYDIYVGMNRVIFEAVISGRIGAGLANAYIMLE